ncbi:MAG: hypothetical protein ACLFQB_03300 [Chitinispirillaceae bacterium]
MNSQKNTLFRITTPLATAAIAAILVSCAGLWGGNGGNGGDGTAPESDTTATDTAGIVYRAELGPLNDSVAGMSATGMATIRVKGDTMFINVMASGLEPGMMHLQHYHGYPDGQDASCASMDQDINGDGIVDLVETRDVSGITLVPFNENPAELELTAETYPEASDQGTVTYTDTVLISELRPALQEKFGIDSLQLENRVVYLHGISEDTELPESVQSLPDVPAHVTLPVACGKLEKVDDSWLPF